MIALVVAGYRGDVYIPGCLDSIDQHIDADLVSWKTVIHDDHGAGMAANVQRGFDWALSTGCEWTFWVEEDFRFHQPVPLAGMVDVLKNNPQLAQVVLKRQPWSSQERVAGGIIEAAPYRYKQCDGFVEHCEIFSLNPCLIPRAVLELGWPAGPLGVGNESGFTMRCLQAGYTFGFYGGMWDAPRCEHVGHERGGGFRL